MRQTVARIGLIMKDRDLLIVALGIVVGMMFAVYLHVIWMEDKVSVGVMVVNGVVYTIKAEDKKDIEHGN